MQVQTFLGKLSLEALRQTDEHINQWLRENKIEAKQINQVFAYERHHHHTGDEPVLITAIWY